MTPATEGRGGADKWVPHVGDSRALAISAQWRRRHHMAARVRHMAADGGEAIRCLDRRWGPRDGGHPIAAMAGGVWWGGGGLADGHRRQRRAGGGDEAERMGLTKQRRRGRLSSGRRAAQSDGRQRAATVARRPGIQLRGVRERDEVHDEWGHGPKAEVVEVLTGR